MLWRAGWLQSLLRWRRTHRQSWLERLGSCCVAGTAEQHDRHQHECLRSAKGCAQVSVVGSVRTGGRVLSVAGQALTPVNRLAHVGRLASMLGACSNNRKRTIRR